MKRIQSACLNQTIHFQLKDDVCHDDAVKYAKTEYANYKIMLEAKKTKYKILDEKQQSDGSIIIKIKRQYNTYDTGDYLE